VRPRAYTIWALLDAVLVEASTAEVAQRLRVHRSTALRGLVAAADEGLVASVGTPVAGRWVITAAGRDTHAPRARAIAEGLREALGKPMFRPRGRPRTDRLYQLRLPVEEPEDAEKAWWMGDGGWLPLPPREHEPVEPDQPVEANSSLGPLWGQP
jgi:hypothetical protein